MNTRSIGGGDTKDRVLTHIEQIVKKTSPRYPASQAYVIVMKKLGARIKNLLLPASASTRQLVSQTFINILRLFSIKVSTH